VQPWRQVTDAIGRGQGRGSPVKHRVVNRGEFQVIAGRKLHDRAKG
jgi:hypothetical protein